MSVSIEYEKFVLPEHMRDKNGNLDTTRYQMAHSYYVNSTGPYERTAVTEIVLKKSPDDPDYVDLGLVEDPSVKATINDK